MRISKLKIHNYRSICDLEMFCENLVIMLGPNNCGKSNLLSAIEFGLSTSSKPTKEDFNFFWKKNPELWVEMTFSNLTNQEENTFKRYLSSEKTITVRKTAIINDSENLEISYNGLINEPEEWWLKHDNIKDLIDRIELNKTPLKELIPQQGRITKEKIEEAQNRYIKEHHSDLNFSERLEKTPFLGRDNVGGGSLPDFYLVPAVKDLTDETKIKTTSSFGRLLNRAVKEMTESDPIFKDIRKKLDSLIETLNITDDHIDKRPTQLKDLEKNLKSFLDHWEVSIKIEIEPPEIEKIFELGTNLQIDDGIWTNAERKGHGIQRAIIFALMRAWASLLHIKPQQEEIKRRISSESIIFAIEEPELFLHPQAQRIYSDAICNIAKIKEHQVFLCTHSTHFIDMDNYKNICIINKKDVKEGTYVKQCKTNLFEGEEERKKRFHMARWINPDRGEMFFAKKVVFVEGETEKVIIPFIAQKIGCFNPNISIIDCGSKFNLPLYISIANAFELSYFVLHDEDQLPPDKLNKDIENAIKTNLGKVEMFKPDFEHESGIPKKQADKKGKPLAALDFFANKNPDEIPERIKDIIKDIYSNN